MTGDKLTKFTILFKEIIISQTYFFDKTKVISSVDCFLELSSWEREEGLGEGGGGGGGWRNFPLQ